MTQLEGQVQRRAVLVLLQLMTVARRLVPAVVLDDGLQGKEASGTGNTGRTVDSREVNGGLQGGYTAMLFLPNWCNISEMPLSLSFT